jgi:hypothetical protein
VPVNGLGDAQGRDDASDVDFEAHSNADSSDEEPVDISNLVRPVHKKRKIKPPGNSP